MSLSAVGEGIPCQLVVQIAKLRAWSRPLNQRMMLTVGGTSISFMAALWFWMNGIAGNANTPHKAIISGDGFGETIRIINSIECNGGTPAAIDDRVHFFNFLQTFWA